MARSLALTSDTLTPDLLARFWNLVDRSGDCWEWQGQILGGPNLGYGLLPVGRKRLRAHRLSYVIAHGDIPAGLSVLHRCDNPRCVNPDHLFLGTRADNVRDAAAKGRLATGTSNGAFKVLWKPSLAPGRPPKSRNNGERNAHAKITTDQAMAILHEIHQGTKTNTDIAKEFGVSRSCVRDIARRRSWAWLPLPDTSPG